MRKINKTNFLKIGFFTFGILILAFLISRVGLSEIIKIISETKINFLVAGLLTYIVLIFTRSSKWFLMIKKIKKDIKFKEFLPLYLINCLIGNLTPFKSGEAASPFMFQKYLKIPVGQGLSIIILDRFFELLFFSLIFVSALLYIITTGFLEGPILSVFDGALAILFLIIFLLIVVITSKKTSLKIIRFFNFTKKISLIRAILEFLEKELDLFYQGLSEFKNKKVYRFLIPLTLLGWFLEFFSFYLIMNSVMSVAFLKTAFAQTIAIAATLATFIPLGIGEVGAVYIFTLFNYSQALSASGILLARLFLTGSQFLFGAIGSLLLKEKKE